ncbi:hypothetical protein SteCoe_4403 [Stentor coeruleus]|uniref:Uncharacterized protein n=1 Tax=Stentor coeruleus TaxID=5963 RepID=A0A1R2CUX1_9CILI|nr:hypothetical protein SteCoe_4403 [Stentor coeruleus]
MESYDGSMRNDEALDNSSTSTECYSTESSDDNSELSYKLLKISENEQKLIPTTPKSTPDINKRKKQLKRWTAQEDTYLLELFNQLGNNWEKIAEKMPGRATSGVKNRFYWICKSSLPAQTVHKLKQSTMLQKMYKAPKNNSELFRKMNNYIREECLVYNFLDLDKPPGYTELVYKLKMTPIDLENHAKMQILVEKAHQLYVSCEKAKENLASLQGSYLKQNDDCTNLYKDS